MKIKTSLEFFIIGIIFTILISSVFGDSDFVLKLQNVNKDPTISKLKIEGENVEEICLPNNCKLEFINSSFIPPESKNMTISHIIILI